MAEERKKNSRSKGKRGELEVVAVLRRRGRLARRGQQFAGSPDSPDVVHDLPGVHLEVKRVERLDLRGAMEQARRDAGPGLRPVVVHRRSGDEWLATVDFEFLLDLLTLEEGL